MREEASHVLVHVMRWRWPLLSCLLLLMFWQYLYCVLMVGYNYAWWVLFSGTVSMASPELVEQAGRSGSLLPMPVPKLIHQTWKSKDIPEKWQAASDACKHLHPDYEYKLWTDTEGEELIATKFPWFLSTYRGYAHNIQRVDAVRYFILYEFGGLYIDLDIHCLHSLDYLRHFNFTAPKTYPIGLSNDFLVSQPKDPFALRLINNLKTWNQWILVKYATVMFSTGPMFVTIQYVLHSGKNAVFELPAQIYGKYVPSEQAYMKHLHGSSWHGNDAQYIFFLEHYWMQLLVVGGICAIALTYYLYLRYNRHLSVPYKRIEMGAARV